MNAVYLLGILYLDAGDLSSARRLAKRVQSNEADHPVGLFIEGLANFQQGRYTESLADLQKTMAKGTVDLPSSYYSGMAYYQLKDYHRARASFQKAVQTAPDHVNSQLMFALTLIRQGDIKNAIEVAQSALAKHPDSAATHNLLGYAYLQKGQYDSAMAHISRAIRLQPELARAYLKNRTMEIHNGKLISTGKSLNHSLVFPPEHLNSRLLVASYHLNERNYSMALEVLLEGLDETPESAILYNNMAAIYFVQNDVAQAITCLNRAKSLKPDYLEPFLNLAQYYLSRRDYQSALNQYQQASEIIPDHQKVLLRIARTYELMADEHQADRYYREGAKINPVDGVLAYANFLKRSGKEKRYREILQSAYDTHPKNLKLTQALGLALLHEGDFSKAIELFANFEKVAPGKGLPLLVTAYLAQGDDTVVQQLAKQVITRFPQNAQGYLLEYEIYRQQKAWGAAEKILQIGIAACNQNFELKMKLAENYFVRGNSAQALELYDMLLTERPNHVPAIFAKAIIHDVQGNHLKAFELYQAVLSRNDEHALALNNLAYLYLKEYDNSQEALRLASQAYMLQPEDPDIIDTLGYAFLKNGQTDKAIVFLTEAERLKPDSSAVQIHLAEAVEIKSGTLD
jgi:tetratricopeptide (TPR) repeat protein